MDIHELRQFESVYKPSKEVAFCWLRKQYVQLSTEENHTEIVDHANDSLRIWQAAKTQAVTDTYTPIVLALEDVQSKIAQASFLTMDADNENEVYAVDANELHEYIAELIEAQEPAND